MKKSKGWHYGVIRKTSSYKRNGKKLKEVYYEIHEVFPGWIENKTLWTELADKPFGETLDELRSCLVMMLNDTYRFPVYKVKSKKLVPLKRAG